MRPSWTGIIAIGAVEVPVRLFPATEDAGVPLTWLHGADQGEIESHRSCTKCKANVGADDLVKGLAVAKGEHVVISAEELAQLAPASRSRIQIEEIVGLESIPREFYEKSYFVCPGAGGIADAYGVFQAAMLHRDLAGIGKVSFDGRERLCAVALGNNFGLMLYVLRYRNEVRRLAPIVCTPDERLVTEMDKLISRFGIGGNYMFRPENYTDEYSTGLTAIGEARRQSPAPSTDLASAIAASTKPKPKTRAGGRSRVRSAK